jgi:hypothetical protein
VTGAGRYRRSDGANEHWVSAKWIATRWRSMDVACDSRGPLSAVCCPLL